MAAIYHLQLLVGLCCRLKDKVSDSVKKQRLDKFISNQLILSRSVVRTSIQRGKATVNGAVVRDAGALIDAEKDCICYDGNTIGYKEFVYMIADVSNINPPFNTSPMFPEVKFPPNTLQFSIPYAKRQTKYAT